MGISIAISCLVLPLLLSTVAASTVTIEALGTYSRTMYVNEDEEITIKWSCTNYAGDTNELSFRITDALGNEYYSKGLSPSGEERFKAPKDGNYQLEWINPNWLSSNDLDYEVERTSQNQIWLYIIIPIVIAVILIVVIVAVRSKKKKKEHREQISQPLYSSPSSAPYPQAPQPVYPPQFQAPPSPPPQYPPPQQLDASTPTSMSEQAPQFCPQCGHRIEAQKPPKFCPNCGGQL